MRRICVVGTGYVGLTTGTCFADLGNDVTCLDIDAGKIANLRRGEMPIYEPGLAEMVLHNQAAGRLRFVAEVDTEAYDTALAEAEFIFIAVSTPTHAGSDRADLRAVRACAQRIARSLSGHTIIINKSTVPIGAGDWVAAIVDTYRAPDVTFAVVSNPEFLREGSALLDFMQPDRVVLGSTDKHAAETVAQLYLTLRCRVMITDLRTAEMIKYASNAFLATSISFINEIARICERLGADVKEVAAGMGYDKRIGGAFLDAGLGFGGSCFPKDVKALAHMAAFSGCHPQLLRAVLDINYDQRLHVVTRVREALGSLDGKHIGLLGLAFKPNTDDMREAPSVDLIKQLQAENATIAAYDPQAEANSRELVSNVRYCSDAYDVAIDADALILVTEWREFRALDLRRLYAAMRTHIFFDGRNLYEPEVVRNAGFQYFGIGRGYQPQPFLGNIEQDLYLVPDHIEPVEDAKAI
ncbi:MAG: UDP-glucose 6-dehydrogenase [Chloroflexi bacterium]|nr:UDP-glucose 6-dehydrogenase [Chloroflexota bacterium]